VTAYTTLNNLPPVQALRLFLENDPENIFKKADPDIRRWLPDKAWNALYPEGIRQMIDYTFFALDTVSKAINTMDNPVDGADLKRQPRASRFEP